MSMIIKMFMLSILLLSGCASYPDNVACIKLDSVAIIKEGDVIGGVEFTDVKGEIIMLEKEK